MLSKLFGKSKTENIEVDNKELIKAIQKMNLTDMRHYINNKKADLIVNDVGLAEVLYKLMNEDKNTKKRYINEKDDYTKIKRCFDIVLSILENNKITSDTIELVIENPHLNSLLIL
jgi:hypothetical protein